MRASHRDVSTAVGSARDEYTHQCIARCRMEKLDVGGLPDHWECSAGHDFSRLEDRPATTNEELGGGNLSIRRVYRRSEPEAGGRVVTRRFIGGDGAAQRASVAHRRVSDVACESSQNRQMFVQNGSAGNLSMCRTCRDRHSVITELDLFGDYAIDVHQNGR